MENNSKNFERIELYLLDKLGASEKEDFEKELESNTTLAEQLSEQKLEHELMESIITTDLKGKLESWRSEIDSDDSEDLSTGGDNVIPINRSFRNYAAIAASVALLIAAFFYIDLSENGESQTQLAEEPKIEEPAESSEEILFPEETTNEQLAQETKEETVEETEVILAVPEKDYSLLASSNYEPFDFDAINVSVRGSSNPIAIAIDHFANDRFNEGEELLSSILDEDSSQHGARYYLGLAHYNQKEFKDAVAHMEVLVEDHPGFLHIENAMWVLALSHLSQNEHSKAKAVLSILADSGSADIANKSKELIDQLP